MIPPQGTTLLKRPAARAAALALATLLSVVPAPIRALTFSDNLELERISALLRRSGETDTHSAAWKRSLDRIGKALDKRKDDQEFQSVLALELGILFSDLSPLRGEWRQALADQWKNQWSARTRKSHPRAARLVDHALKTTPTPPGDADAFAPDTSTPSAFARLLLLALTDDQTDARDLIRQPPAAARPMPPREAEAAFILWKRLAAARLAGGKTAVENSALAERLKENRSLLHNHPFWTRRQKSIVSILDQKGETVNHHALEQLDLLADKIFASSLPELAAALVRSQLLWNASRPEDFIYEHARETWKKHSPKLPPGRQSELALDAVLALIRARHVLELPHAPGDQAIQNLLARAPDSPLKTLAAAVTETTLADVSRSKIPSPEKDEFTAALAWLSQSSNHDATINPNSNPSTTSNHNERRITPR